MCNIFKKTLTYIVLIVTIVIAPTVAKAEPILLGTLNHPQIEKFESIVRYSYEAIGLKVEFITTSAERRLVSANDGLIDGLVAGTEGITEKYPNLIQIEPSLSTANIYLICLKELECNTSVLFDKDTLVISFNRTIKLLEQKYNREITANIVNIDRIGVTLDLLKHKRASYAIYTLDDNQALPTQIQLMANTKPLLRQGVYHYIHKKHQHLANDISAQLSKQLKHLKKQSQDHTPN